MSDRAKIPSSDDTNPPHAQLFIAASLPLDFNPKIDFKVPSRWMVAVLIPSTETWLTAQGRQNEARYALIKGSAPPEDSKFFEVASIPVSGPGDVEARIRSVLPEESPDENQARDALLAVETFAEL